MRPFDCSAAWSGLIPYSLLADEFAKSLCNVAFAKPRLPSRVCQVAFAMSPLPCREVLIPERP